MKLADGQHNSQDLVQIEVAPSAYQSVYRELDANPIQLENILATLASNLDLLEDKVSRFRFIQNEVRYHLKIED